MFSAAFASPGHGYGTPGGGRGEGDGVAGAAGGGGGGAPTDGEGGGRTTPPPPPSRRRPLGRRGRGIPASRSSESTTVGQHDRRWGPQAAGPLWGGQERQHRQGPPPSQFGQGPPRQPQPQPRAWDPAAFRQAGGAHQQRGEPPARQAQQQMQREETRQPAGEDKRRPHQRTRGVRRETAALRETEVWLSGGRWRGASGE